MRVRGIRSGFAEVWVVGDVSAESAERDFEWIWCVSRVALADCVHDVWRWDSWCEDLVGLCVKSVFTSWITYSAGFMYSGIC